MMDQLFKRNQSDLILLEVSSQDRSLRNEAERSIETLILSLTLLLTIYGNASVVFVLVRNFTLKNVPNMLLFYLTMVNLLIAILNMPFALVSTAVDSWIFDETWCVLSAFLNQFLLSTSNGLITVVAVYRYQAIANTFSAQITIRGAKWMVSFAILHSFVFSILPVFGWNLYLYSNAKGFCTLSWSAGGSGLIYTIMVVLCTFIGPFIAIVYMYIRIGVLTRYNTKEILNPKSLFLPSSRKIQQNDDHKRYGFKDDGHKGITRRPRETQTVGKRHISGSRDSIVESKTLCSVSFVIVTFGLLLAPYYVVNMASAFSQDSLSPKVDFVVAWLQYCHSPIVAVVYGYNNRRIKTFLKQLPWWPSFSKSGDEICQSSL
ncbi:G-protein coupled receptor 161-like [Xenia sp. Carnegie-2017]|uniref:G-protein coupled receptor 161-like n=1 Tax=Xenia sp. Carnegie-2017 TaxID=2897299 RepID=UPI001F043223|nr:G-protein coupled receptor 161-like [Xenia sp. Carnegie-2017]